MKWHNIGKEFEEIGKKFIQNKKLIFIGDNFDQTHYYINKSIPQFLDFLNTKEIHFIKIPQIWLKSKLLKIFFLKLVVLKHNLKKQQATVVTHFHHTKISKAITLANSLKKLLPDTPVYHSYEFFEKYLSIYSVYVFDKAYIRDTCIIATTKCTLNCRYCLNFTAFIKNPQHIALEKLKEETITYFSQTDYVGFFQISGGEPLLYKELGEYLSWLKTNFGQKTGQILLATNGTCIPNPSLTKILSEHNILLLIDNYTQAIPSITPKRNELIRHLKNNSIDFRNYENNMKFYKFFPPNEDYSSWTEKQLADKANKCWGLQPWRNLRNGKIYYCNFSSFAVTAGIIEDNPLNYFDLKTCTNKKELIEFALGYSKLGYDTFCTLCNGINEANTLEKETAGIQAHQKYDWNKHMTLKQYEQLTNNRQ